MKQYYDTSIRNDITVKVYPNGSNELKEDILYYHHYVFWEHVTPCFTFNSVSKVPAGISHQVQRSLILKKFTVEAC